MTMKFRSIALAGLMAMTIMATNAQAATLIVDVSGSRGFSALGGLGNSVQSFVIGAGSRVVAIRYDISITANDPSFLSEAAVAVFPSIDAGAGLSLTPGVSDDVSGTSAYAGSVDLRALNFDFAVGGDGILRLEYFDAFVDGGLPDSVWNSGTITVTYDTLAAAVPEPATWGMMTLGLALVGGSMRRRTRSLAISGR